jgi:hypothetical protein
VGAAAAVLGLAACGGGGGDSGGSRVSIPTGVRVVSASAAADLTPGNAATISAPLVRAIGGTGADSLLGASREQALAAGGRGGALSPQQLDRLVRAALGHAVLRERALQSESVTCPNGGSMTVSAFDNDGNGVFGRGDSIQFDVVNCVVDATLPAMNGSFGFTVNAIELAGYEPQALDVTASFTNFGAQGYGVANGAFRLWTRDDAGGTTVRISYQGAVMTEGSAQVVYNFDTFTRVVGGQTSTEISGGIGIGGETFAIETVQSFVGTPTPTSGVLRLKDAQGDFVLLTARSATTFDLGFYLAGNPTVPALSLPGQLWSAYRL